MTELLDLQWAIVASQRQLDEAAGVLSQNLDSEVLVMQAAESWDCRDAAALVRVAERWSILL